MTGGKGEKLSYDQSRQIKIGSQGIVKDPSKDKQAGAGGGGGAEQISEEDMKKLMEEMEQGDGTFGDFVEVFAQLICASQEYVRASYDGERSVVSLRDVARCVKIFRWFGEFFAKSVGAKAAVPWTTADFFNVEERTRDHVRRAMLMSLAYCYYARLGQRDRKGYGAKLQEVYLKLQEPIGYVSIGFWNMRRVPKYGPRCTWLDLNARVFGKTVDEVMRSFVRHVHLGPGIALNDALLENLFMIMVSILNQIPIFVVGKPGTSKSLAMKLIMSNMNGEASESEFFRHFPSVSLFSYQCSPLSTSAGIEQAFMKAHKYKQQSPNSIVIVLLDEVGLAEQSPHLPLKVLHKVLDEGGDYSLVGISNWALDPAKMNRAVHLFRAAPGVEDLSKTAQGMVQNVQLDGFLRSIARAYDEVYRTQKQRDFWGLREFYSTVKHINLVLREQKGRNLDGDVLVDAVQRNFGGKPEAMADVLEVFFRAIGLPIKDAKRKGVVQLVSANINSKESRQLMLLTKNGAALRLLFGATRLLDHATTEVIYGSDFPADQNDLQIMQALQQVKLCMAQGRTVVLVHCEALYESLYDLLNQHYTEFGNKLYVRIAFGTSNRLCEIDPRFRIIVVVEKIDAYNRLAPPLLNRFEKQVLERKDLLDAEQCQLLESLQLFARIFACGEDSRASVSELRACFTGYHIDMLASLIQSLPASFLSAKSAEASAASAAAGAEGASASSAAALHECIRRLLWTATPESVCRVMDISERQQALKSKFGVDVGEVYFSQQSHADLVTFSQRMIDVWADEEESAHATTKPANPKSEENGADTKTDEKEEKSSKPSKTAASAKVGSRVELLTFTPFGESAADLVAAKTKWTSITTINLHELSSERDLRSAVSSFFGECKDGDVFLLQCDPQAASLRRIEHSKYILERERDRFATSEKFRDIASRRPATAAEPSAGARKAGGGATDGRSKMSGMMGKDDASSMKKKTPMMMGPGDKKKSKDQDAGEEDLADSPRGVHVIVLIHLQRGDVQFQLDYSNVWRQAFIDDLDASGDTGLPDLQAMLRTNLSMEEIIGTLDVSTV
eukprot:jgi/Bigna1/142947/aug1.74_g17655